MIKDLKNNVLKLKDEIISIRRDFHQNPELSMEEIRTAQVVAERLSSFGLQVATQVGKTGVVGLLEGAGPGKTLMLRADMDALPIKEKNEVPYRSRNDGVMHACGHDGHMACLLTVAKILSTHRHDFSGLIKFVFQPGEEGFAGAHKMIEDGVLENPPVDAALGLHINTGLPCGVIATRAGAAFACMDYFKYTIKGKGAHAARPEDGADTILMSVQLISALQSLTNKEISPIKPMLIHVGTIQGGDSFNVVAEETELKGTVRTYDESIRKSLPERMNRIGKGITEALRGSHKLEYEFKYPPLVNDKEITELVRLQAVSVVGIDGVMEAELFLGGEDMAFFLEQVPGCFFWLGAGNNEKGLNQPLHNARFDFDEDALMVGVEVMIRSALTYLHQGA